MNEPDQDKSFFLKDPIRDDPRTPAFYDFLRSQGNLESDIVKTRDRLRRSITEDNLTEYFIHEVNNAIVVFKDYRDENGNLLMEWDDAEYDKSRQRLLNINRGLDWFKETGVLHKTEIKSFLDTIEALGPWSSTIGQLVLNEFKPLAKIVKNDLASK